MRLLCCALVLIIVGAAIVAFHPLVGTWICIIGACSGAAGLCINTDHEDVVNEQGNTTTEICATTP